MLPVFTASVKDSGVPMELLLSGTIYRYHGIGAVASPGAIIYGWLWQIKRLLSRQSSVIYIYTLLVGWPVLAIWN